MSAIVEDIGECRRIELSVETPADEIKSEEQEAIYYPITQRDPNDVRTILRLAVAALAFAVLSLTLAGLLTYKLTRSASLIVVERTPEGDRVVGDDQHYTLSGPVQVLPDKPGDGDKKYLAAKWAESFFQIDPRTRRADIVRGLKMMTPEGAVALVDSGQTIRRVGDATARRMASRLETAGCDYQPRRSLQGSVDRPAGDQQDDWRCRPAQQPAARLHAGAKAGYCEAHGG